MNSNVAQGPAGRGRYWRLAGWSFAAALLALPLGMMQVSSEWHWTASDFLFAAGLIGTVGIGLELAARVRNSAYLAGAGLALLAVFLLVWLTGAAGIIGDEGTAPNLMFFGVIALAALGSAIARFRPEGMALAMAGAAAAELLVGVAALVFGLGADEPPGAGGIQLLNGFFVALWLLSAACFRHAAKTSAPVREA